MTTGAITIKQKVAFARAAKGRKSLHEAPLDVPAPVGRLPRVTRLLALAIRFDELLRQGKAQSYAELAAAGNVTRARLTQIMNLLNLAPDIQEELLALPHGSIANQISERHLRSLVSQQTWNQQRALWSTFTVRAQSSDPLFSNSRIGASV
jgi:hypothetical protein